MEQECYYAVLNVEKTATQDEIRKAYKSCALKFHPDKQVADQRDAAEARFKQVAEAYEILHNPDSRDRYDRGEDLDFSDEDDLDIDPFTIFSQFFGDIGSNIFQVVIPKDEEDYFENLQTGEWSDDSEGFPDSIDMDDCRPFPMSSDSEEGWDPLMEDYSDDDALPFRIAGSSSSDMGDSDDSETEDSDDSEMSEARIVAPAAAGLGIESESEQEESDSDSDSDSDALSISSDLMRIANGFRPGALNCAADESSDDEENQVIMEDASSDSELDFGPRACFSETEDSDSEAGDDKPGAEQGSGASCSDQKKPAEQKEDSDASEVDSDAEPSEDDSNADDGVLAEDASESEESEEESVEIPQVRVPKGKRWGGPHMHNLNMHRSSGLRFKPYKR